MRLYAADIALYTLCSFMRGMIMSKPQGPTTLLAHSVSCSPSPPVNEHVWIYCVSKYVLHTTGEVS